jgi:hypothetical protein
MTEENAITLIELREIVAKARNCFTLGLIDANTANKIRRSARRVIGVFRARLAGVNRAELELRQQTLPADIAELREADRTLDSLLASRAVQRRNVR